MNKQHDTPSGQLLFESGCELVDVTSLHRPDTSWQVIDAQGHEHCWYVNGLPAGSYNPATTHETPTLVWIKDGEEYWEDDDEPHAVGHLECRQCGERLRPGYTADAYQVYVPGLRWYRIDGERVTEAEFMRRRDIEAQR